ncbi:MAG: hypothetical protein JWP92_3157 [Caulobacter sp.]|nr:hypothetical protein [Caulobacter sp.]
MYSRGNSLASLTAGYPDEWQQETSLAISEAWMWLESQVLLIPAEGTNGSNGWRVLSRRAQRLDSIVAFNTMRIARLLPKDLLHSDLPDQVWVNFMRGDFDTAVFQTMKAVEIGIREAAGFSNDLVGVRLARDAFHVDRGPLRDATAEAGERQSTMELFAGALGTFKNPQSHRLARLKPLGELELWRLTAGPSFHTPSLPSFQALCLEPLSPPQGRWRTAARAAVAASHVDAEPGVFATRARMTAEEGADARASSPPRPSRRGLGG